jgi:5-formyltetrahydrofolate cyclo-ligase
MTKAEARKEFLQKRANLSEAEYHQLNFQLYQQFFSSVNLSHVRCLHVFLSIDGKREVDTWPIMDRLRREYDYIRLSIPKVKGNELEHIYFEGLHQLKQNKWGILEPQQGTPTPTDKIDMVLVPLLAFDERGHRVGYGKGFYDTFLAKCRPDCQKIGLSLFKAIPEITDSSSFDVALNGVIQPNGFSIFK